jgi:hypothetical protein
VPSSVLILIVDGIFSEMSRCMDYTCPSGSGQAGGPEPGTDPARHGG